MAFTVKALLDFLRSLQFDRSIRFKMAVFVMALLAGVTIALHVITARIMSQRLLLEVTKRAESLGKTVAVSAGYSLASHDLLGLDNIVYTVKEMNPDIDYATITKTDMKIIAHSDIDLAGTFFRPAEGTLYKKSPDGTVVRELPGGDRFEVMSPVVFKNKTMGTVFLGINKSALATAQGQARKRVLEVFVVTLAVGIAGSIIVSALLTRPIRELAFGVMAMKTGESVNPIKVYSGDELGRLSESFNEMTALITKQRAELIDYSHALEDAYVSTVRVVSAAIDARDPYTRGHSERVSGLSRLLAQKIGLEKTEVEAIEIACLFHDVGKIKTRDSILLKKERLTAEEYAEMMRHTEYGAAILDHAPSLRHYIPAVRHHHEWFDGTGYPDRLVGDRIPLHAAIIAIADAFDAMTSDRPYRNALSVERAFEELRLFAGRQFNPELVEAFIGTVGCPDFSDIGFTKGS